MVAKRSFDIVVAGGGIAGSCFAGVMGRAGYGVLLVEREARFRDRVRSEITWPWGHAEIQRCGLRDVFDRSGAVEITGMMQYVERQPQQLIDFIEVSIGRLPALGYIHPVLQEAAFTWAEEQGVVPIRPAKIAAFRRESSPRVSIQREDESFDVTARLVVGATGKNSNVRNWTGGDVESDPDHHRIGGVLMSGVRWSEILGGLNRENQMQWVNWFPVGPEYSRVYVVARAEQLQKSGIAKSFDKFAELMVQVAPEGEFDGAEQAGPIAFFPNRDTWATRVSGEGVTLIGDAAGALDPTYGHGTPQLFRDIRILSEALIGNSDWQFAIDEYAERRNEYFGVLRESDRWKAQLWFCEGVKAERRREQFERAKQSDPTLGGWAQFEALGPDGLIPDESARRHFFGEDL